MYHKVGFPVSSASENYLNVSAASFHRQMQVLFRLGYRARTFEEIARALRTGQALPVRSFAVTFDDGYHCVWESAFPILQELRW